MTHPSLDSDSARLAFETALREHKPEFETFFLSRFIGLRFTYADGGCTIEFPVHNFMFNPQGSLHGGVISFALDVSMGHLLRHTLGFAGTTMEMKTQYFAPVRGPQARCHARFLHQAKSIHFLEAHLFDADGGLAAAATSTWSVRRPATAPEA
jgi:uncharacterized protein (TIGR00369 family)